ncbi:hypothetical protein HPDP_00427 [Candidatus Hepatincola sp. Pdp]
MVTKLKIILILILGLVLSSCSYLLRNKIPELDLIRACSSDYSSFCSLDEADRLNAKVDNYLNNHGYETNILHFKVSQVISDKIFLVEFFRNGNVYLLVSNESQDFYSNQIVSSYMNFKLDGTYTYETVKVHKDDPVRYNTVRVIKMLEPPK